MKPLSVGSRITILVLIAILFGATMIALSIRTRTPSYDKTYMWDNDKKIERTFSVHSGGTLFLDADVGNISIVSTDSEELSATVYVHGTEEQLRKFNVKFDQDDNSVKIKGRLTRYHFRLFSTNSLDILFEVRVPKNFNLNLQTSGGNIDITGVTGNIDGETSGGNIELSGLESIVKMSTSGGNVSIKNSKGDFTLETSGGNMYGESITGPLFMETSGGNIEVRDIDGKLRASTSGGNIYARAKDNQGINLSTSGGNITVEVPSSITADVRAEASGGDVSCELEFSGKIKDGTMNGKINNGGKLIRLETSGGDIVINPID